jgi:hypothetical protein
MQRGYLMGLRRVRAKAQAERDELADQFEGVIDDINAEMRGVRDELARRDRIEAFARAPSPSATVH